MDMAGAEWRVGGMVVSVDKAAGTPEARALLHGVAKWEP